MFYTLAELVNVHSSPLWAQVNPFAMRSHATSAVTMKCPCIDHLIPCAIWWWCLSQKPISSYILFDFFFYKDVCAEILFHSEMEN